MLHTQIFTSFTDSTAMKDVKITSHLSTLLKYFENF